MTREHIWQIITKWWINQNNGLIKIVDYLRWWNNQNGGLYRWWINQNDAEYRWWIIKNGVIKMVD